MHFRCILHHPMKNHSNKSPQFGTIYKKMSKRVIKKCLSGLNGGSFGREAGFLMSKSGSMMRSVQCKNVSSSIQFSKNGNMMKNGFIYEGGINGANQHHRNYSTWLNWFKGTKDVSTSNSTTTILLPSMVDQSSTTVANSVTADANAPPVMETDDDDLFRGLQLIHETPQHEYHPPLTFGEEHELFVGGHLPHTMPHINYIQDLLQYLHDTIGKQFI